MENCPYLAEHLGYIFADAGPFLLKNFPTKDQGIADGHSIPSDSSVAEDRD
jgi:hypothetical protein